MWQVVLRLADESDLDLVFSWRNLPELVCLSTQKKTVTYDEHSRWFINKIRNDGCRIFIILFDKQPIGQIRFERGIEELGKWKVSIYLITRFRKKGFGASALKIGCAKMQHEGVNNIIAFIRTSNESSLKAFRSAGFSMQQRSVSCPADHYEVRWNCP